MDKEMLDEVFYGSLFKDDKFDEFIEAEKRGRYFVKSLCLPEQVSKNIEDRIDEALKEYYLDDIICKRMVDDIWNVIDVDKKLKVENRGDINEVNGGMVSMGK